MVEQSIMRATGTFFNIRDVTVNKGESLLFEQ